jgi:hypothetical protein
MADLVLNSIAGILRYAWRSQIITEKASRDEETKRRVTPNNRKYISPAVSYTGIQYIRDVNFEGFHRS